MKGKIKKLLLIIFSILLMTGCSDKVGNVSEDQEQDDGIVNVLYYYLDGSEDDYNLKVAERMLRKYGKENNIEVRVKKYSNEELSHDDFALKRNTMLQSNEADIVFDTADNLYEIKNKCGDYSKLSTYENIWDNLKGYYCIPLFLESKADKLNDEAFEVYGIKPEKDVLTRQEYYEIKQFMKENGARFALNKCEIMELVEYYTIKNNVRIKDEEGKYSVNEDALKQTVKEVYEDVEKNYDTIDEEKIKNYDTDYEIRDEVTNKVIRAWNTVLFWKMADYERIIEYISNSGVYEGGKSPDSSIVIDDIAVQAGRNFQYTSLFIRKNSADEVYKIAGVLLTEDYYKAIGPIKQKPDFSPAIDTPGTREYINVDENWRYAGEIGDDAVAKKGVELFNRYYEIIRQKDISNIFTSRELREIIPDFIVSEMEKLIKNPEQVNRLDRDIDDFIVNLNVRHNS